MAWNDGYKWKSYMKRNEGKLYETDNELLEFSKNLKKNNHLLFWSLAYGMKYGVSEDDKEEA